MANRISEQPQIRVIFRAVLLLTLVMVLPGTRWSLFGWSFLFLPLAGFYTLRRFGRYSGNRFLATAVCLSLPVYLLQGNFELFLFAAGLLSTGYILFLSADRKDTPARSWLISSLGLGGLWIAIILLFSLGAEISPYGEFVRSIDLGIAEALDFYRQSGDVSADTKVFFEETLQQMRVIIPLVLPSLLGSFVLVITWLTMVVGNALLQKSQVGGAPWVHCRYWQLPDKLIWLVIGAAVVTFPPVALLRTIGINTLVLMSVVYCFQGLSIAIFFMQRWKVPVLLRSFFYVMMIFQSFGTLLLLFFGIADIWVDFRKLKVKEEE